MHCLCSYGQEHAFHGIVEILLLAAVVWYRRTRLCVPFKQLHYGIFVLKGKSSKLITYVKWNDIVNYGVARVLQYFCRECARSRR